MNALPSEERKLTVNTSLSADLAQHMLERIDLGQIVIVSKQPTALLSSVRKQWHTKMRQIEKRRASTLDAAKILEYTKKIARMQTADFVVMGVFEPIGTDVVFASAEQLLKYAPMCRTMYIATPTELELQHQITTFMPPDGLIVTYKIDR